MIIYDFEVFKYDWLVVIADTDARQFHTIVNDPDKLKAFYEQNVNSIWCGYNSRHYDQYILKAILLGIDPKEVNDKIIVQDIPAWRISSAFRQIPLINYDVMPNPPVGLKTLEGFMGSDIKETDVPFDIDRKLTDEELQMTIEYCTHDVEQTMEVFMHKQADFDSMLHIVNEFKLPLSHIGDTEARITANVLGCEKHERTDELDYFILPCIQLKKYKYVEDWFLKSRDTFKEQLEWNKQVEASGQGRAANTLVLMKDFYKKSFDTTVAGIPHSFGFGGLHGAADHPVHHKGLILHVDVNNYYPSMLIAHGLVTRSATNDNYKLVYNTRKALKMKQVAAAASGDKKLAKAYKKQQLPYKKMLNALSGAMKDNTNPAYDPRNNNIMCINGQLMLLDLIEHLEVIKGFQLIQSNTDGLIVQIPDTDEAFNQVDDICYEWESRCSTPECDIKLELDTIKEIYQKDVNNYLWIDPDGSVGERKGAYVMELSPLNNDLPIVNKAMVDYLSIGVPVEKTILSCEHLIDFQKLVKLSGKYTHVLHEHCEPIRRTSGVRVIKEYLEYPHCDEYSYKCYRVFASKDRKDGRILKAGGKRGKPEKFANTPEHCHIVNDDMSGVQCPSWLDKQYYINMTKERLKQYGV